MTVVLFFITEKCSEARKENSSSRCQQSPQIEFKQTGENPVQTSLHDSTREENALPCS